MTPEIAVSEVAIADLREAIENGRTDLRLAVAAEHQHLVEGERIACLAGQFFHQNNIVIGDFILFAAGLDHCKHFFCRTVPVRTLFHALCGAAALPCSSRMILSENRYPLFGIMPQPRS